MPVASELRIRSSLGDYEVRIGEGVADELLRERPADPLIADEFLRERLAGEAGRLLLVPADEQHKTLGFVETLIERLRELGAGRGDRLVALGGGIVQDVATAVASLYMRGLEWTYAPTTLLAMADSCIGGKSSLNVGRFKNLAGNFHPPRLVVVDPTFLATLSDEDRAGGLCEALKISFCRGPEAFERHVELAERYAADDGAAAELLHHVLGCKAWFVEVDEFDRAERRQLNFGHTFGHALEAATGFAVSHGIAVGVGVIAAERLAVALDGERAAQPRLVGHALELVRRAPALAERLAAVDADRFLEAFLADKKHRHGELRVILPVVAGGTEERALRDGPETRRRVVEALAEAARMVAA